MACSHKLTFGEMLGLKPIISLVLQKDKIPFAHEAGVLFPDMREPLMASKQVKDRNGQSKVQISKIFLGCDDEPVKSGVVTCNAICMANGGVNYAMTMVYIGLRCRLLRHVTHDMH